MNGHREISKKDFFRENENICLTFTEGITLYYVSDKTEIFPGREFAGDTLQSKNCNFPAPFYMCPLKQ